MAAHGQHKHLSHQELVSQYGADEKDLAAVETFARQHGLQVVEKCASRRIVILSGTVEDFSKAFGVTLEHYEHPDGTYRGRTGHIQVPAELAPVVEGVFGLDNRPFARPHFQQQTKAVPHADSPGFSPTQVAKLYNFPTGVTGQGQCIGIIELGGGFRPKDLNTYFGEIHVAHAPTVVAASVDQGHNRPSGDPGGPDGEVMLDIEVAGAVAPGAKIVVYFTPDATDRSFLDAINAAVHDTTNNPSVISISWGGPESSATQSFMKNFDDVLQAAAALGITVCCASGDDGAADMTPDVWDGNAHVDFPASSPFALACGGTRLEASGSTIVKETVWNQHSTANNSFGSTGGGISAFFPVPDYQKDINLPTSANPGAGPGRGVPDVAGDGDPASGYRVRVDGQEFPIGGTSAVAPLWAGLIALINESKAKNGQGRAGFINPKIYAQRDAGIFNDVVEGNNRVGDNQIGYDSGDGWDACTGLGSPNGEKLAQIL
jgi:kumamolisin